MTMVITTTMITIMISERMTIMIMVMQTGFPTGHATVTVTIADLNKTRNGLRGLRSS